MIHPPGRVLLVSVTLPLVLLPILLVRLLTVAGGVDGLSAWLAQETPPAVKLRDWRLWQEAGMQVSGTTSHDIS